MARIIVLGAGHAVPDLEHENSHLLIEQGAHRVLVDCASNPVIDTADLKIYSSPVQHLIPTIGLRVEFFPDGKTLAYSCDTEPCPQVVRLAKGADILLHEATGASKGHSSALPVVEIFSEADAKQLYLIHYSACGAKLAQMMETVHEKSARPVSLIHDFQQIDV